jgi:hypothetical protein
MPIGAVYTVKIMYASRRAAAAKINIDTVAAIHCSGFSELRSCFGTGIEGLRNVSERLAEIELVATANKTAAAIS